MLLEYFKFGRGLVPKPFDSRFEITSRYANHIVDNRFYGFFGLDPGIAGKIDMRPFKFGRGRVEKTINIFESLRFPTIRRVFANLLANDIVSVQPMNAPIGRLYFLDPLPKKKTFKFGR